MEYIDDIVKELLNGTFSVFCGAGASGDATNKKWIELFTDKTQSFYKANYSSDLYFLADLEKRYINPDNFLMNIYEKLSLYSDCESEHINNIVNLNINQIWTTNFDHIIENTVKRKLGIEPKVIEKSKDILQNGLDFPYTIYKLNGSIPTLNENSSTTSSQINHDDLAKQMDNEENSMVLTKSDYFDYFEKQRLLFEVLKRQLVLDSFLFVGYSFSDNLVLNALREIKKIFPCKGKAHYRFVMHDNSDLKNEYYQIESRYYYDEYNIKSIYINEFTDIDIYLKELYRRFCNHNVFIAGSFRQLKNNNERIYIEKLVRSIIQKLTNNCFNIYSGNGRGLGEIVVAQVNNSGAEKHFVNRPLIFTGDSDEQKERKNQLIIRDCDTMIIVCGQDDGLKASKNVISQFKAFMNNNNNKKYPLVIPIPSTGYAAEKIYNSSEFKESSVYLTNKKLFDDLATDKIETISEIVGNLVQSYKNENS
ncbi:MAG: SIR2 family protein [Muribaculaceae bacterium]|nr:SIR2 family protein [Muribaculaceae bacterium]